MVPILIDIDQLTSINRDVRTFESNYLILQIENKKNKVLVPFLGEHHQISLDFGFSLDFGPGFGFGASFL